MKKFFGFIVACLLSTAAHSADYEESRKLFLNQEIQNRNILSGLYLIQSEIKKLHSDKTKTQIKIENAQKNIEKIGPVVEKAEIALMSQKIQIQKRLQYISKFQDLNFLKIIFSNQTPSQMERNLRILKGVTEMDYVTLKGYFLNTRALIAKKKELFQKKEQLAKLAIELSEKEKNLTRKLEEKNLLVEKINKQQKTLLSDLKKMREKKKNILTTEKKEFLDVLFEPLFFEKKGMLKNPLFGKIIQDYGVLEHPIYKTQFRHKGIFVKPMGNSVVRSISGGKVSYIEENKTFGTTLVVDHGDHYYSVYSFLQNSYLKQGDVVAEAQEIASVGHPHPFFGEGLYFEIRHFSEPINPREWLDKKTLRR